jgi:hypothetical protein
MTTSDLIPAIQDEADWALPDSEIIIVITGIRWRILFQLLNPFQTQIHFNLFKLPEPTTH